MARKISKRQQQIYDYIRAYQQEKGYPPSVREMAAAVGLSSPSTVHAHLSALEARGLIKRDATKPRALELFNEDGSSVSLAEVKESPDRGTVTLPLVGRVAAGMPILAEQNVEDTFTLPTEIATDASSFVLEVHGDSMINAGIFNGDYLVVREQKNAMNGEIVVAMIDNEATVKTFYKERGRVRLQPENDAMEPIYAENPQILGKVVALMRRFLGADVQDNAHEDNPRKPRIAFFDSVRGFTIISMVAFHAAYDAAYLYGFEIPWFTNPIIQTVWRSSISWVFLALAGWMTSLSRNNLKRGGVYAAAAGAVFLATSIAGVDTPISFGIIYCMAACTLLYAATAPLLNRLPAAVGLISCLVLFAATYTLPHTTYPVEGLAWLGFPSASFVSGDYYPLLPNVFLYLAGAFAARWFDQHHASGYPMWMMKADVPFLSMIGKLSLPIYLVHQPLLILIFTMVSSM